MTRDCKFNPNHIICGDTSFCYKCGWNPEVAERRKENIRNRSIQEPHKDMTLDDAIIHALEESMREDLCEECRKEHQQLADWLIELKELRAQLNKKER